MNTPHYHINIFWSAEEDCFIAEIPDLKHCTGQGDTPEEALTDVMEAQDTWIIACLSAGESVPDPEYSASVEM
mgnify:FL=1